jgi:integrase
VEDAVVVMRRTGLRVTAATSMEFNWVDFDRNRIDVPKLYSKGKHEYATLLDPTVRAILERRRSELGDTATKVFPEVRSSRHLYERVAYMVKALIKRGEWKRDPKRYNHALRVAFITEALDNGVPLVHVAKLAGHGSTRMTERYNRASSQDAINSAFAAMFPKPV